MRFVRLAGLMTVLSGVVLFTTDSGTQAQIKIQPKITPGGGGPGVIQPPIKMNPVVPPPVKMNPVTPMNPMTNPGGTGLPSVPGGGGGVAPPVDAGNFPKEVGGKKIDYYIKEIRSNTDPAVREQCVRVLPAFGWKAIHDNASELLLYTLTKDSDINVRMAVVSILPSVGLAAGQAEQGKEAIFKMLDSESTAIRIEALNAIAQMGYYGRKAIPRIASVTQNTTSWQLRRVACVALGYAGAGVPAEGVEADNSAVTALIRVLRTDSCLIVRREAISALINIGPNNNREWKAALEGLLKSEADRDRGIKMWCRVCLLKNDPNDPKPNDPHLGVIAGMLANADPVVRAEVCTALGMVGERAVQKLNTLLAVIADCEKEEPNVVLAAITAVTAMPSQSAVTIPALQKLQEVTKDDGLRSNAASAIEYITKVLAMAPVPMKKG